MTKDKLFGLTTGVLGWNGKDIHGVLNEFFESNVCIPKGDNRHPDADILHFGIEGSIIESNKRGTFKVDEAILLNPLVRYRIKPSEPVYEWQWYDIDPNNEIRIVNGGKFMTEDECGELTTFGRMRKFEETKQERKQ